MRCGGRVGEVSLKEMARRSKTLEQAGRQARLPDKAPGYLFRMRGTAG
jgi:hypothetical protein